MSLEINKVLEKINEALHKSVIIFRHLYGVGLDIDDIHIGYEEVIGIKRSTGFDDDREYDFPLEYLDLTLEQIDARKKEELEKYLREEKEMEERRLLQRISDLKSRFQNYNALMNDCQREYKSLTGEELK